MMRLRMPNGILTSGADSPASATIANRFGRGAVDITTRQNIQLRWIRIEDVPADFRAPATRSASSTGSPGMDNIRNVTGCPVAGLDPDEVIDASPMAAAIQDGDRRAQGLQQPAAQVQHLASAAAATTAPRSQTHDLEPDARRSRTGVAGFNVRVGGAMGGKSPRLRLRPRRLRRPPERAPRSARRVLEHLPRRRPAREPPEGAPQVAARSLGRRALPRRTRGAHRAAGAAPASTRSRRLRRRPPGRARARSRLGLYAVGCLVPVGRTTGDDLLELGRLAASYGSGEVRLTNDQNVLIVNVPGETLAGTAG